MSIKKGSIERVISSGLCTGCGTCVGVCPRDAVNMIVDERKGIYIPEIEDTKCDHCGICFASCPGYDVPFKKLDLEIFGNEAHGALLGNFLDCYAGYACDFDIRYNATSGGLITSLLIFWLKEGIIDGALVTKMDGLDNLRPQAFIARTEREIISAMGSKYCPVPVNTVLKEVIKHKGRYAVVGLPCHIAGIRKAEKLNKALQESIIVHLGLVCNHTPTFVATKYLLGKFRINETRVESLQYRGRGWPGGMLACYDGGQEKFINHLDPYYWGFVFNKFFWPQRCFVCNEKINRFSDIVFMDAWLPEFVKKGTGYSMIIVRSLVGLDLMSKAREAGEIEISAIPCEDIVTSQGLDAVSRRAAARKRVFQVLQKPVPEYGVCDSVTYSVWDLIIALWDYCAISLGSWSKSFVTLYTNLYKIAGRVKQNLSRSKGLAKL